MCNDDSNHYLLLLLLHGFSSPFLSLFDLSKISIDDQYWILVTWQALTAWTLGFDETFSFQESEGVDEAGLHTLCRNAPRSYAEKQIFTYNFGCTET